MSQMLILPHLDVGRGRQALTVDPGMSVAEMVALAFPGLADVSRCRVVIGEHVISPEVWHAVRPRPGATVIIRAVPGQDPVLRSVLTVAVLVAAVALGQYYAPAMAGALLPASFTGYGAATATAATLSTVAAVATAGFALAGTALLNALVPPPTVGDQGSGTSIHSITGLQNTANPGGVISSILGTHRYAPVYAATPYTEIIGDDQYVIAAFLFGHGPLNFANHQLGDSDIGSFSDVQMEIRQGLPGDTPLTLYPQQVIEEQLSVELRNDGAPATRFTARDATEVSIDITFVQGLVYIDDKGRNTAAQVLIQRWQRKVGDVEWMALDDFSAVAATRDLVRRTMRWTLPERGQYEIKLYRIMPDRDDNTSIMDRSDWSAIRSFRPESPFNFPDRPLAMVALRIRATGQLNGIVNNYNAVASLVCKDWDAATGTWIVRETSSPASLYRHVLQGPANVEPKTDDEVDLPGLQDWHEFCAAKGLTYNRVHDYNARRLEVLKDIAAAGRATPHDDGEKWGVTIDRPQTTYVSAISPRNSWDFQGSTPYVVFPDAHRVQFIDAANGWSQAERIVPFPGVSYDAVEATEDMKHPGVTDPDQIWKATRRRQYELIHRPHTYTVNQDFESLVLARGNMAPLNHDILDRDHVAARVKAVSGQLVTIDTPVVMEQGRAYAISFRTESGDTVRRSVATAPGEVSSLRMIGDLAGVAAGDLALFGTSLSGPAIDVLVKNIERGDNLTAKLTLLDAAPQIDTLTDADVPPPWNGRVGGEVDVSGLVPAVPAIAAMTTDAAGLISVAVAPGSGSIATPASYVVSHRPHGGGAFTTVTILVAEGVAQISGYLTTDTVDVKVRAVSAYGQPSADSATSQREGFVAFSSGFTSVAPGTSYLGIGNAFASEAPAHVTMPTCTVDRLVAAPTIAPGGTETIVYTLRKNGVDTALTCTVTGAAVTAGDNVHSVSFASGDTADVEIVVSSLAVTTTQTATVRVT